VIEREILEDQMEMITAESRTSSIKIINKFLFLYSSKTNRKTEYKDKKFGFGGQKKNSKRNTADSSADVFNKKSTKWQRPSFHAQKGKKV
jgi:hypothetical protein